MRKKERFENVIDWFQKNMPIAERAPTERSNAIWFPVRNCSKAAASGVPSKVGRSGSELEASITQRRISASIASKRSSLVFE